MKRIFALILALCAILSLAACGTDVIVVEKPAEKEQVEPAEDAFIVLTSATLPPYCYSQQGKLYGIDIDVAMAVAGKLGIEVQVSDIPRDALVPTLAGGGGQLVVGALSSEDANGQVLLSTPYAVDTQVIVVRETGSIPSLDVLATKKIGVFNYTCADVNCTDDFGEENITRFSDGRVAVATLLAGEIDCIILDEVVANALVRDNSSLSIEEFKYYDKSYSIGVSKDNPELLEQVNAALKEMSESGELDTIIKGYIR